MIEFIRNHRRFSFIILFLLIIPSFMFVGVAQYNFQGPKNLAATVADIEITINDLDTAHRRQVERFKQLFGDSFNDAILTSEDAKLRVLDELIKEAALSKFATDNHIVLHQDHVIQKLKTMAELERFRKADGSLDVEQFSLALANQGTSLQGFVDTQRILLGKNLITSMLENTAFQSETISALNYAANNESRLLRTQLLSINDFRDTKNPSDADLEMYYQNNKASYRKPERVALEYVEIDRSYLSPLLTIDDAALQQAYQAGITTGRYKTEARRRASHILLGVSQDKQKVLATAQKLHDEIAANPERFAELAKQYSQDPGSQDSGGDLGYIDHNTMSKPFEDALFALKKVNDISPVVETEFGYHIIQLTELQEASVQSFDEVKQALTKEIVEQRLSQELDRLNKILFDSDDLMVLAQAVNKKVQSHPQIFNSTGFVEQVQGAPEFFDSQALLSAIFQPDVLEGKQATRIVQVSELQYVAARVEKYTPAGIAPLSEVKQEVSKDYADQKALERAKEAGEKMLAEHNIPDQAWKEEQWITPKAARTAKLPEAFISAVFRVQAPELPKIIGVVIPKVGYQLVEIKQVKAAPAITPSDQKLIDEQQQIEASLSLNEVEAFTQSVLSLYKVKNYYKERVSQL